MMFAEIDHRLRAEEDPARRNRLGQFVVEVTRALPNHPVDHAAYAGLQLAELLDIDRCENLTQVIQKAWRLPLYPESEWRLLGHLPMTTATAIYFEVPRENPSGEEFATEAHYLHQDMIHAPGAPPCDATEPLPSALGPRRADTIFDWSRRVVHDPAAAEIYAGFQPDLPAHTVAMLGNLWKIGAVARWSPDLGSATSRQRVNPGAVAGFPGGPGLSRRDAWYHLDINPDLGRDVFAEICLCVASILSGYSPQVWENPYVIRRRGPMRIVECEAAGYIACGRLGAPRRQARTEWFSRHSENREPLPEDFQWELVLETAARVEDLFRGDTGPVWSEAKAALDGE